MPVIRDTFEQNMLFPLPVTGYSMLPTLRPGRDRVFICKAELPLRKFDIPLYQRDNGRYILHRVVSVRKDGTYRCRGDHQIVTEQPVRPDQIIAVVAAIERSGRRIPATSYSYRLYVRVWHLIYPIRYVLAGIHACFSRIQSSGR